MTGFGTGRRRKSHFRKRIIGRSGAASSVPTPSISSHQRLASQNSDRAFDQTLGRLTKSTPSVGRHAADRLA